SVCGERSYSDKCFKHKERKPTAPKRCQFCDSTAHTASKCFYRPQSNTKPCKYCGLTAHFSWQCHQNPKREEEMSAKKRNGKQSLKWIVTRKKWFGLNKADHYNCYICGKYLLPTKQR